MVWGFKNLTGMVHKIGVKPPLTSKFGMIIDVGVSENGLKVLKFYIVTLL